jgi:hypothetical protein
MLNPQHKYHLVDPSPWPILSSIGLFFLTLGAAAYLNFFERGFPLLLAAFVMVIIMLILWWREDVVREGTFNTRIIFYFLILFATLLIFFLFASHVHCIHIHGINVPYIQPLPNLIHNYALHVAVPSITKEFDVKPLVITFTEFKGVSFVFIKNVATNSFLVFNDATWAWYKTIQIYDHSGNSLYIYQLTWEKYQALQYDDKAQVLRCLVNMYFFIKGL